MGFFLETHSGECGGFGAHFYDQEKGSETVSTLKTKSWSKLVKVSLNTALNNRDQLRPTFC